MHFWIDKRSLTGQRRAPTAIWCHRHGDGPKRARLAMAAPVHRYPAVPTASDTASRRLTDPVRPPPPPPPLTAAAGPPASSDASEPGPASPRIPSPAGDEVDCMPCCCVLSSTVIGVFMLTAMQMYLEHIFHHSESSSDLTGIIFLFAFLFVCLLFFARLVLLRKRRGEVDRSTSARSEVMPSGISLSDGEPPPYEEAVRLPAPPTASPPPDYDKVTLHLTPPLRSHSSHMPQHSSAAMKNRLAARPFISAEALSAAVLNISAGKNNDNGV